MEKYFNKEFFGGNRAKLREVLSDVDLIVISAHGLMQKSRDEAYPFRQESNFWYLSGLDEPNFVLVINGVEEYLIRPEASEYLDLFSGKTDDDDIARISGVKTVYDYDAGWEKLSTELKKAKKIATLKPSPEYIKELGMYSNPSAKSMTDKIKQQASDLEVVDAREALGKLRSIKQPSEIDCMRQAAAKTIRLYQQITAGLKTGKYTTENDVAKDVVLASMEPGAGLAYSPIVASGKNAAVLHYERLDSAIKNDEPLLIDAALSFYGYCSDITRTYLPANPTKLQTKIYEAVLATQKYAISLYKPGVSVVECEKQILEFVATRLKEIGLIAKADQDLAREFYPHSTSHFLGLDAHDSGDYTKPLQPGMVLTVEPGIYIAKKSVGIRIEDDILITDSGCEVLTGQLYSGLESARIV